MCVCVCVPRLSQKYLPLWFPLSLLALYHSVGKWWPVKRGGGGRKEGVNSGTNTNTLYSQTFLKSPSEALTILSRTCGKVCTHQCMCVVIATTQLFLTTGWQLTFSCCAMCLSRVIRILCASGLKRNLEHRDVRGSIILECSTTSTLPRAHKNGRLE